MIIILNKYILSQNIEQTYCQYVPVRMEDQQFTLVFSLFIFNVQESARYDPLNEYTEPNHMFASQNVLLYLENM